MSTRVDGDGRWESSDGVAWALVEPSQDYLDRRAAEPDPPPEPPSPEARLAALEARIGTPDDAQALRDAILSASNLAQLKDALLGNTGPGVTPGRPT